MNLQPVYTALFKLKTVSPTVLTVVGIAGVVTATVMACRATLKVKDVIEEANLSLDIVEEDKQLTTSKGGYVFSQSEISRQKAKVILHTAWDLTVLYGPAVVVGVVSIGAIAGGHGILLKRNAALAGALTLTEKAFDNYRKAVAKEIGEVREKEIRYDTTEDRGDTVAVKNIAEIDPSKRRPYARMFEHGNPNWERNSDYNHMFLTAQQEYANQKFQRQGWLLLNDVLHALGFEKTSTGAVVGWAKGHGDDFVDFGVYELEASPEDHLNASEQTYLLDFNVAGVVYTMIGEDT